jgi:hypothetical protein
MMDNEIELWCILNLESLESLFRVSLRADQYVGNLRNAVKAENPATLAKIDARKLSIWQVYNHKYSYCLQVARLRTFPFFLAE